MNGGTSAPRRRARPWLWLVLALFALSVLLAGSLLAWLGSLERIPVNVVIDGTEVWHFDPSGFTAGHWATLAVGVMLAAMVVVIAGVSALVIGLVLGLGVPMLVLLLTVAVLCSPLLLLGALGVWLWRRSNSAPASTSAPGAANIGG
ncbi:MAG TPA: hypothetical protein VGE16_04230 [Albitalea sp.]